jgi:hypothetical protein
MLIMFDRHWASITGLRKTFAESAGVSGVRPWQGDFWFLLDELFPLFHPL